MADEPETTNQAPLVCEQIIGYSGPVAQRCVALAVDVVDGSSVCAAHLAAHLAAQPKRRGARRTKNLALVTSLSAPLRNSYD